ncbi:MAG: hypothetical protein RLZZ330_472, partial [Actinomycetota bacterium]
MRSKLLAAFAGLTLLFTTLTVGPVSAGTLDMGIGPDQSEIDASTEGGWSSAQIGLSGRPFLANGYLRKASDDSMVNIGSAVGPTFETFNGNWRLLISPNNLCHSNQTPAPGVCYTNPNRVTFSLAYIHNGNTYNDFSGATLASLGVTEEDTFHFDIDLNDMANDLSWTWVSGTPTWWSVNDSMVTLEVHPAMTPSTFDIDEHCSTIPVSTCDTNEAADEIFTVQFVMSFDDTLDAVFDHTLFASTDSVIASLETAPGFDPAVPANNAITYGMSAPHLLAGGADRIGTFYALLNSDQLAAFGVTDPATVADTLKITRSSSDEGTFDAAWSAWNADDNGTEGQLLTLTNISFSVPKFTVNNGSVVEKVVPKL